MDLIITDSNFNELGYLKKYELDLEIGKYGISSNDFQLTINIDDMVDGFSYDSLLYIENLILFETLPRSTLQIEFQMLLSL